MKDAVVRFASDVDPAELSRFLRRFYSERKARFLVEHGSWWHRGDSNRWVVVAEGAIAGYCAVIPGKVGLGGMEKDVVWWVDLIVAPEFRGRRLQRVFDGKIKQEYGIVLGFPNTLAATIHRRHGWGVAENLRVALMPLRPLRLNRVRRRRGISGFFLLFLAACASPVAAAFRLKLKNFVPKFASRIENPTAEILSEVWEKNADKEETSTIRNEEWFRWRFFQAPYNRDLRFYGAGRGNELDVVAVVRWVRTDGRTSIRVLDLFGSLDDRALMRDVLLLIGQDAARKGADQVTMLVSGECLLRQVRAVGFVATSTARFCWWSSDRQTMKQIFGQGMHWSLADSDNDEP